MITFTSLGFTIRCLKRDWESTIASLREKYGDSPILWGKNILKQ